MTENEIEKLAQRVAKLVLDGLSELEFEDLVSPQDEEQDLLSELATLMTQLDYNLQKENYNMCERWRWCTGISGLRFQRLKQIK